MLSLSIRDGEGFTLGADVVIRFDHDPRGRSCQVHIQAPRKMVISRADASTVRYLVSKLQAGATPEVTP